MDSPSRITFGIASLSCAFVWFYCVRVFYQNESKPHFNKRGTILIKAYLFSSGAFVIVFIPSIQIFYLLYGDHCTDYKSIHNCQVYGIFRYLILLSTNIVGNFIVTIFFMRILLQFINVRRTQDVIKWKYSIDPNYTSFALKYFHILGHANKLITYSIIAMSIILLYVVILVITIGVPYTDDRFDNVFSWYERLTMSLWVLITVVILYCILKLRHFIDYWEIRSEFGRLMKSSVILTILNVIKGIVLSFVPLVSGNVNSMINGISFSLWITYTWYIGIIWVNKVNSEKDAPSSSSSSASDDQVITIVDVLQDERSSVCIHYIQC